MIQTTGWLEWSSSPGSGGIAGAMPRGYSQEELQGMQTALKAGRPHSSAPRNRSSGSSWAGQLVQGVGQCSQARSHLR